ncbi:MAG TPA: NAD-dependent epimerase/dehydratase family protein [Solirubrobacteraceae bacterium]|jgi:nucleoside-diphosphate-sugar epimerase|nr:NAD-dependent epimerase/dehydratase family protein [Solirubrobacteraceae bacterium]
MSAPAPGAVLVTGASGFIGGRLAERLSGEGRRVRCLVRASSDTGVLEALPVELVGGELGDPASLRRAAAGCERVVHCAAMVSDWGTVEEIRSANVAGTVGVLAAARAEGARRLVHISSSDVYGHAGPWPLGEDAAPRGFANWYAQTKLEAERALWRERGADGPELVILRPATVYGPGSREVIGEIARAILARRMVLVGRGRSVAGLCFVENLIDAVLLALDAPEASGETFNVSDGLDVTWARFTADLADGLGAPPVSWSIPYPLAFALARALEGTYRLARRASGLQTAPLLSRQAVQVLGREQSFSIAKARATLGWEPRVSYEDGLRETLAWLREREPARRRPAAAELDAARAGL